MATLPNIQPHTLAKHQVLRAYLDAWFPILAKYQREVVYLDGFAGPGRYASGEPGSPLVAFEAAKWHLSKGTIGSEKRVRLYFVELKSDYASSLEHELKTAEQHPQIEINVRRGEFRGVVPEILDELGRNGRPLPPLFAFVDPFGFSGVPLHLMLRLLSNKRCEVFVNIMIEFINRFIETPDEATRNHMREAFGIDAFPSAPPGVKRVKWLKDLYAKQLRKGAKYVRRFDILSRRNANLYSLFFATNHELGCKKAKEAMWSVDPHAGERFSDADPAADKQAELFLYEPLREKLRELGGQSVSMASLEELVFETEFLPKHLRSVLSSWEKEGRIRVTAVGGKRRAGTFPPDRTVIHFEHVQ